VLVRLRGRDRDKKRPRKRERTGEREEERKGGKEREKRKKRREGERERERERSEEPLALVRKTTTQEIMQGAPKGRFGEDPRTYPKTVGRGGKLCRTWFGDHEAVMVTA
jgi:hypothetical protein